MHRCCRSVFMKHIFIHKGEYILPFQNQFALEEKKTKPGGDHFYPHSWYFVQLMCIKDS